MRIAINAVLLGGVETGVELYIRGLLRALAKADERNEYLVFVNKDVRPEEVECGPRFTARHTGFHHGQRLRRILWEQFELPKILARERVDLLHAPAYVMPLKSPVPTVVTMHDILAITHPRLCRRLNAFHYGFTIPRTARRAGRIVASSHATETAILDRLGVAPEKVTVIYPGLDETFRPEQHTRCRLKLPQKYILFVGRIEPKKNVPALLRAFAWLRANRGIEHKLVLVGPEECTDPAAAQHLADPAVRDAIVRLRYPPRQDLPGIYAGAEVFVFPSLVEGFGFPPLEAMACGTPIVASNIPVLQETLGSAAITVPPDDPKLLALAIHKVLTNAFLRRSLIERGAERARQFNWPDTARRMVAVYEEVASDSQRRT